MSLPESQLYPPKKRSLLFELDMGTVPGMESMDTGAPLHDILGQINPIEVIGDYWKEISDVCIEAIVSSGINYDANVFYEGAIEGFEDRSLGKDNNPDESLRHDVMFVENLDYIMGYQWGYKHAKEWDGDKIPASVMRDFIELQIEEYKERAKIEITKDVLFTAYDNISPNRILRKAYYPIKDAYKEDGWEGAIKKGIPLATTIAVIETLDQVIIPLICINFGLPPLTNAVGLGELLYPILLPKLGGKESIDFVEKYKDTSGNKELSDDIIKENKMTRYIPHSQRPVLLTEGFNFRDIFVDVIQVGIDSGAIVVTGGAGGDTIADLFIAAKEAEKIYGDVQKIFNEVKSLAFIIKKCLTYDLSKGLEGYYKLIQKTTKDVVKNGLVGKDGVAWLEQIREEVQDLINRIVRAVSKWVGALIPDDFGLGGPAFEGTITTALGKVSEEAFDYTNSALSSLPTDAQELLLDEVALKDFLEDCASGLKTFVEDLVDKMENPDPDKAGMFNMFWRNLKFQGEMTVAPLTGLVNVGANLMGKEDVFDSVMDDYLDTLETLPSWHPSRKLLAWGLPKVGKTLGNIEQNHCGLAAKTLGYLMKVLMGGLAILQTSFDEKFVAKLEKIKPNDVSMFDFDDIDIDLSAEDIQMEGKTMRMTESKLRRVLRQVITEAQGDGLSDPEVMAAYEELADMGFPDNVKRADFAPDTNMSWLDEWPYSEALEIMHTQEGSYDDFEYGDTDEERYAEMEAAMRARQNRGMYEGWRRIIREFGEKDHELRQKLANREKLIGIGMDGGTMPFNPNWDYDNKSGVARAPRGYMSDVIKQVPYVIENNDMHEWLEAKPTRDPDVIHLESGGLLVKVENDYGTLNFKVIKPRDWDWSMECETIDNEIDNVLYELSEYVNQMENPEDF